MTITDPNSGAVKELKVFSWRKFPKGMMIDYSATGFKFGAAEVSAPDINQTNITRAILGLPPLPDE